jgi:hypothetical protein
MGENPDKDYINSNGEVIIDNPIVSSLKTLTLYPKRYKVCEDCELICSMESNICNCGHYRFIEGKRNIDNLVNEITSQEPQLQNYIKTIRKEREVMPSCY